MTDNETDLGVAMIGVRYLRRYLFPVRFSLCPCIQNDAGAVLIVGLILLGVMATLGATAMSITSTDALISGNYRTVTSAFHAAEAATEEARGRMRGTAATPINDAHPTQTGWRAYIGNEAKAQGKGYSNSNSLHVRVNSLQTALDYTAVVQHATDGAGNILYWGDHDDDGVMAQNTTTGENIYVITGYSETQARSTVQIQAARTPPITVPGALYVEAQTTVQGSSTYIIGTDACGADDHPAVQTTLGPTVPGPPIQDSIKQNGNPNLAGSPSDIVYNHTDMNIQAVVDTWKDWADFSYTVTSVTHTASTTPGPGDNWGQPIAGATLQDPSTCSVSNIVHYDTGGTYVKLSGGVTGCGILLVEGDLELHGNFSWYGPILVTGSVILTGGGNKNITGAVLSGGSAVADVIGGNANIIYCSDAVNVQSTNRPLVVFNWREL